MYDNQTEHFAFSHAVRWAKALGIGDFYSELGVQIVEACWASREASGGLMELPVLLRYVNRRRGRQADPVSEDDVVRSVMSEEIEKRSDVMW